MESADTSITNSSNGNNELRKRKQQEKVTSNFNQEEININNTDKVEVVEEEIKVNLGKTPNGTIFKIPETFNMLSSLFNPNLPKSNIDILTLTLLLFQIILFFSLKTSIAKKFYLIYFLFWRLSYDLGLGYILIKQSKHSYLVKIVEKNNWLNLKFEKNWINKWIKNELEKKMGKGYDIYSVPIEFNVWILFRHFVDVILLNDFLSYVFFAFSYFQWSTSSTTSNQSISLIILRWLAGLILISFNLWVKIDAHRIVKDYAWYWGDTFFQSLTSLTFDGVFNFAPHPMYSVGYAGYYGLSLIVASETVLCISILAHMAQFGFLIWFENPHIERTYGGDKVARALVGIGKRVPLVQSNSGRSRSNTFGSSFTSGDEEEDQEEEELAEGKNIKKEKLGRKDSVSSSSTTTPMINTTTRHDLDNKYFKMDLILFKNFDFFRSNDLTFFLLLISFLLLTLLPPLSSSSQILLAFAHCTFWRIFHSGILGIVLKKQSEEKWIVRHFLKHYLYPSTDEGEGAVEDAFGNWKKVYNLSLVMTYASFGALAWKCYSIPTDWTVGSILVRHVLGLLLIALHIWTSQSTYEVLGPFGWFYGDFFIQNTSYPLELYYTGIFRFLNNPERSMGGCAFFGLVLICGTGTFGGKLLAVEAVGAVLGHWWFLSFVENPHMKKLYGNTLRKHAGLTQTLKEVVDRNSNVLGGMSKSVREVQGSLEKVLDETGGVLEEFLMRSKPKIKGYVADTKVLLKQSGERLVITRISNDLSNLDQTLYSLSLKNSHPSSIKPNHYQLGESITVNWTAPINHSKKDWIGIYRLGANKSNLITRVSSQGHWLGVNRNDWNGDDWNGSNTNLIESDSEGKEGKVTFSGKRLPWEIGVYELRYHHDGKHNVLAIGGPIEIYVKQTNKPDEVKAVHETLTEIVANLLGLDPAVIPTNAKHLIPQQTETIEASTSTSKLDLAGNKEQEESSTTIKKSKETNPIIATTITPLNSEPKTAPTHTSSNLITLSDPDDFIIISKEDAEHIAYAIKISFGVELTSEVVVAAANVGKLVGRVLEAKRVLKVG